jgi:predicted nucleotidyltransferase
MSNAAAQAGNVDQARDAITAALGADLHSLILYGSHARGNAVPGMSDLNLLIVLSRSTPEVHATLRGSLAGLGPVEPLVFSERDLPHTFAAFAAKFVSIKRNYRLLTGVDILQGFEPGPEQMRFLVAQGLRNLKLRLTRAYLLLSGDRPRYTRFVLRSLSALIVDVSEAARLAGTTLPAEFEARIPALTAALGTDCAALGELLALKRRPRQLTAAAIETLHGRLLEILRAALWLVEQ